MGAMASQITSLTIVYSTIYSGADQRKHQSSASLAFVRGIHQWPVNSLHKGPVMRKLFPFDDIIMKLHLMTSSRNIERDRHDSSTVVLSCIAMYDWLRILIYLHFNGMTIETLTIKTCCFHWSFNKDLPCLHSKTIFNHGGRYFTLRRKSYTFLLVVKPIYFLIYYRDITWASWHPK